MTNTYDSTAFYEGVKKEIANVSDNVALINFPTDQWGFTSGVRKAVLQAASRVEGQDDKHDLLVGTLSILVAHIRKRKVKDTADRELRFKRMQAAAAELLPRQTFNAGTSKQEV